jgi:hypothetical protein
VSKTIATAVEEIDIVFFTPNSFKRDEREGIIDQLAKKLDEGIKVRILLIPTEDIQQSLGTLTTLIWFLELAYIMSLNFWKRLEFHHWR